MSPDRDPSNRSNRGRNHPVRRDILRASGGILAVGGLAGCIGNVPLESGSGRSNSFWKWLHEPGEIIDVDHYSSLFIETQPFVEHEDELPDSSFTDVETFVENTSNIVDLDLDEIQWHLGTNVGTVLTGSFEPDELEDELEGREYDDESDHEDFTVFLSQDERRAVGISSDAVVTTSSSGMVVNEGPVDVVESVVDTSIGDEDRYLDSNEDLDALSNGLPSGAFMSAETSEEHRDTDKSIGVFDGQVASGRSVQLNGETSEGTWVIVFDDENDVDVEEVEEWIDELDGRGERFDDFDDLTVSQSGRTATVTGTIDTDDLWES